MSRKPYVLLAIVIVGALSLIIFGYTSILNKNGASARIASDNSPLKSFTAKTVDEKTFSTSDVSEISVYEVFASWCIPCRETLPAATSFAKSHKDIDVIGVAYRDVPFEITKFEKKYGKLDTVIMGNGKIERELSIRSVPQTIFVADNKILFRLYGGTSPEDLEKVLALVERKFSGRK